MPAQTPQRGEGTHLRVQAARSTVLITSGPRFGPGDVADLERRLRLLPPIDRVLVDLGASRQVDDCAVAQLAHSLDSLAPTVEFRGLSLHQRRLLRYLGHGGGHGSGPPTGADGEGAAAP